MKSFKDPFFIGMIIVLVSYLVGLKIYRDHQQNSIEYYVKCPLHNEKVSKAETDSLGNLIIYKNNEKNFLSSSCEIQVLEKNTAQIKAVWKCDETCKSEKKVEHDKLEAQKKALWDMFWSSP